MANYNCDIVNEELFLQKKVISVSICKNIVPIPGNGGKRITILTASFLAMLTCECK